MGGSLAGAIKGTPAWLDKNNLPAVLFQCFPSHVNFNKICNAN